MRAVHPTHARFVITCLLLLPSLCHADRHHKQLFPFTHSLTHSLLPLSLPRSICLSLFLSLAASFASQASQASTTSHFSQHTTLNAQSYQPCCTLYLLSSSSSFRRFPGQTFRNIFRSVRFQIRRSKIQTFRRSDVRKITRSDAWTFRRSDVQTFRRHNLFVHFLNFVFFQANDFTPPFFLCWVSHTRFFSLFFLLFNVFSVSFG